MHLVEGEVNVPAAFDDFEEFRAFAAEYRVLLGRIARLVITPPNDPLRRRWRHMHQLHSPMCLM